MTATASRPAAPSNLARRTIVGLIIASVVLASVATLPTFTVVCLAITIGCLHELSTLSAREGQGLIFPVGAVAVAAYMILASLGLQHEYEKPLLGATIVASMLFSLVGERRGFFGRCAFTLFGRHLHRLARRTFSR